MNIPADSLDEILRRFDETTEPFDEIELAEAIQDLARKRGEAHDLDFRELAEGMAFSFAETRTHKASRWGTYYGPMSSVEMESGETIDSPSIERVTPETIAYWLGRVEQASHPRLRARYADLVFDFSERATGHKPDYRVAQVLIDETLRIVDQQAYKHALDVHHKLKRAYDVAILQNDKARREELCSTIITFEEQTAEDGALGTWGRAFDLLIGDKGEPVLGSEQEKKIIDSLESRLARTSTVDSTHFDPFAVEAAALRLARYYRRAGQHTDLSRVLMANVAAWTHMSSKAMPSLGRLWLEKAQETLLEFGLREDAERLEGRVRELAGRSPKDMVTITQSAEFTNEEVNAFLDEITAGTLNDTLTRIAVQFVPNLDETKAEILQVAKRSPLYSMFTKRIIDREGRVVAEVGPPETDMDGQVASHITPATKY